VLPFTCQFTVVFEVFETVAEKLIVPPGRTVCVAVGKMVMLTVGAVDDDDVAAFLQATAPREIASVAKSARCLIVRRCPLIASKISEGALHRRGVPVLYGNLDTRCNGRTLRLLSNFRSG